MARFSEYKLVADFKEWQKTNNPDKLYCITTEQGEELFDVYEDDFISMIDKGIVNSDGSYYLLNNPTEEQIKEYAKQYGIRWKTKHEIANDYVYKATMALVDAITEDIKELTKVKDEFYVDNDNWLVSMHGDKVILTKSGLVCGLEDMPIQTLIDIDNALLCGDYR